MSSRSVLSAVALLLILLLAFSMARLPHEGIDGARANPYPLHLDEYLHWGRADAVASDGTTSWSDPWFGGEPEPEGRFYHEVGFHVFLAAVHLVTGLEWVTLFGYGPGLVLALTALGAYLLGWPHGFGHEAALFTAFIPTSVRFLGPAMLVPVSFALPLFLAALVIALRCKGWPTLVLLLLLYGALWLVHIRVAAFFIIPALLAAYTRFRDTPKLAVGIAVVALAPVALAVPALSLYQTAVGQTLAAPFHAADPSFFENFGLGTLVLFAVGVGGLGLVRKPPREVRVLAVTALAALAIILVRLVFDMDPGGMYARAHMLFFVTAAPVAGYGFHALYRAGDRMRLRPRTAILPRSAAVLLVLLAATGAVNAHAQEFFTPIMDQEDFEAFTWIDENLPEDMGPTLLRPQKAVAFTAVTGRLPADAALPGRQLSGDEFTFRFYAGDGKNTTILREHGVEVVYSPETIFNPDLERVHDRVYIVLAAE